MRLLLLMLPFVFSYVDRWAPVAQDMEQRFGVPASVQIAQGALESGWGRSVGAVKYNAHHGIRGEFTCYVNGKRKSLFYYNQDGKARAYLVPWDSWKDYNDYLRTSPYYKDCWECNEFSGQSRAKCWAQRISNAYLGPNAPQARKDGYARKLINIMDKYNLYQYDRQWQGNPNRSRSIGL